MVNQMNNSLLVLALKLLFVILISYHVIIKGIFHRKSLSAANNVSKQISLMSLNDATMR